MSSDIIKPGAAGASGYTFHGHVVRSVSVRGQRCRVARDCGAALDYEEGGKRFVRDLTTDWKHIIREGVHWYRLKGEELRDAKAQLEAGADPALASDGEDLRFASELIVITDVGLNLALLKSGKPRAVEFQLWLAGDVVPEIARTGKYDPTAQPAAPAMPPSDDLRRAELVAEALRGMGEHIAADQKDVIRAHVVALCTGLDPRRLLPVQEQRWKRPDEIAAELGVTRYEVSRALTALKLREKERSDMHRVVRDLKSHGHGTVDCLEYCEAAVAEIREWIAANPWTPKRSKKKAPAALPTDPTPTPANDAPEKEGPTAA
ncbi:BRO family protein [Sorangium sp. So ce834]|uniref:BRO-N domain-containing protein n=1 Tax=Sorangium sp. So ce834 TaxID=3133321 RepID=UPI003F5E1D50